MSRNFVSGAFVTALVLYLASPVNAQLGGGIVVCSNCSTSLTQGTMKITQDLAYAKQLLQYAIQVQQLADALQNTAHGGRATLTDISADLTQLANVVQGGQALAYSLGNQDVLFRQTFPGYQTLGPARRSPPPPGTYASQYAQWAQTSLATTQGILRGAGLQGRLLAGEQGVLGAIRALTASNLLNRNDAINVGGQLAAEQVGQLQKLRELQLEDMTSKAAYQGYVIQRQASNEAGTVWFFSSAPARGDGRLFQPGLH
jgi:type IV secretion system protein TrbJ